MKKGIIFDMDGTLWDSADNVAKSWTLALQHCGFEQCVVTQEDMYRVMGGHNSMKSWVQQKLGGPDYIHFTRNGAARMGELFYNAIKLHFDYYQFRKKHDIGNDQLKEIQQLKKETAKADTLIAQNATLILTPIHPISTEDSLDNVGAREP